MNHGHIRFVKRTLFALLLGSSAYVGYHLWDGLRNRPASAADALDEPENPTSREIELEQLDSEGRTAWTLKAAESVGRTESSQLFRDVEIRFDAGADQTPVVVTADDCEIRNDNTVHLSGNVVVVDDTTLRLEANTLEFARLPDRVWSTEPVRYGKKGLSGTAGNMHYVIPHGELDFGGEVAMTFKEKGEAPVHVSSKTAHLRRNQHWIQYVDRVRVRQQRRRLHANDLQLYLDEHREEITHIEAYENVDLRMDVEETEAAGEDDAPARAADGAGSELALASEPGLKQLLTDRLEMIFRPGGEELERVRALEGGRLIMKLPPDATEGLDKELEGNLLAFEFDEQGRLVSLRGRGGVTLVLTPTESGAPARIVRARQLESEFDPETGDLIEARCERAVEFEQGDVRASSDLGVLRAPESLLVLTETPRLWDPRASLEAERIEIDVDSGDVNGEGDVRSSSLDDSGGARLFPSAEKEPVYFVSERMRYERATDVAIYTGAARGFQGRNRVEAETIQIHQSTGDLVAEGDVRTVFLQKLVDDGSTADGGAKPTVTRAKTLHYRSDREVLEYREDVQMRSDEMTLQGASVDVTLVAGGEGVVEIFAEGDVEIETVDGKAAGDNARYLPKDESMTVIGESAWLENAGKLTEGKQLTFFLTDDRILVDGQEQSRTKTTYTSKPRPF